jgi:hypothetical protein
MNIEIIHESLVNDQREQMVKQIDEYGDTFWEKYKYYLDAKFFYSIEAKFSYFSDAAISYYRIRNK